MFSIDLSNKCCPECDSKALKVWGMTNDCFEIQCLDCGHKCLEFDLKQRSPENGDTQRSNPQAIQGSPEEV